MGVPTTFISRQGLPVVIAAFTGTAVRALLAEWLQWIGTSPIARCLEPLFVAIEIEA